MTTRKRRTKTDRVASAIRALSSGTGAKINRLSRDTGQRIRAISAASGKTAERLYAKPRARRRRRLRS